MSDVAGSVAIQVKVDNSNVQNDIQNTGSSIASSLKSALSGAVSFALGQGIFDTVTSGFKDSIGAAWNFDSALQQNKISFSNMLGSADQAGKMLSWAEQFSDNTPFQLEDVETGTKRLLAMGFASSQIPSMMKNIGDAASGMGTGASGMDTIISSLGKMNAEGKVNSRDMMELVNMGIPAWNMLAQGMGISVEKAQDLSQKGLLPANKSIQILLDGMETKFPNMMQAQSKSFAGLMTTLKDNTEQTMGQIVEPAFNNFSTNVLPKVVNFAKIVGSTFKDTHSIISAVAAGLKAEFGSGIADTFKTFATVVKDGFGFLIQHGKEVVATIAGIATAMAAFKAISTITTTLNDLKAGMGILKDAGNAGSMVGKFGTALSLFKDVNGPKSFFQAIGMGIESITGMNPQMLLISVIIGAIALLAVLFITHWKQVGPVFEAVWKAITGFFVAAKNVIMGIVNAIVGFFQKFGMDILLVVAPFVALPILIITHWNQIVSFFTSLPGKIVNGLKSIGAGIASIFTGGFNAAKSAATNGVNTIGNGIKTGFMAWLNQTIAIFSTIGNGIKTAFSAVVGFVTTVVSSIAKAFSPVVQAFTKPLQNVGAFIQSFFGGIGKIIVGAITLLKNIVMAPILLILDAIYALCTGHWNKFFNDFKKLGQNIQNAVQMIGSGIQQVISSILNIIHSIISAVIGAIVAFVKLEITGIQIIVSTVLNFINSFIQDFCNGVHIFVQLFIEGVHELVNGFLTFVQTIPAILQTIWNAIMTALNAVKSFFEMIGSAIIAAFNAVVNWFKSLPGTFASIGNSIGNAFNAVVGFFENIGNGIKNTFNSVVSFFYNLPGNFASAASSIGNAIIHGFDAAINFIKNLPAEALKWGGDIINGIVNGIKNAAGAVGNAVNGVAQNIRNFLHFSEPDTGPLVGFHGWWKDMMYGMADDINTHLPVVTAAVQSVATKMASSFKVGSSSGHLALAGVTSSNSSVTSYDQSNSGNTTFNFNGDIGTTNKNDIHTVMNEAQQLVNRRRPKP